DIGVNFYQEIPPDDHRFAFWVVDVGRDDRATTRNFVAHELGRDLARDICAEGFAGMLLSKIVSVVAVIVDRGAGITDPSYCAPVFADGNEFHLWSDDALPCVPELSHGATSACAQRFAGDCGLRIADCGKSSTS